MTGKITLIFSSGAATSGSLKHFYFVTGFLLLCLCEEEE